ncbi:Serine phosphatase RsbU, regulator of sigma subunit [Olavius sp. associated proteobacterium Delta 1]|nr:Serine phosphatase RsbU, regulator of sigma subunit [Olavius sp. associated proteobacterium Delta 1]
MVKLSGLQQRLALYMFFPVALLLAGMGIVGFIYARNSLLIQWGEASNLKLQRAAHQVDMRLGRAKEWLKMFHTADVNPYASYIHELVIEQLRGIDGVARVDLSWTDSRRALEVAKRGLIPFREGGKLEVTAPRYDEIVENKTISLVSDLKSESGRTVGKLEVVLRFEYLIDTILAAGWWQSDQAYLVDDSGRILSSAKSGHRRQLGENNKNLEVKTLTAMKKKPYGTVMSSGFFPSEVSGYYRLKEAPWTLIMIAPGKQILSSVIRFRLYYFISGTIFISVILLLIKLIMGRTVSSIEALSDTADRVARGDFVTLAPSKTRDEVAELIHSFNTMVVQLEERSKMKETMDLAMDVQQNLLPQKPLHMEKLDIAGKSIYCDETGGDYFDFFRFPELGDGRVGIAVGDVVGHGVPAALLMTTVRAFLRSRMAQPGDLAPKINDVNRLLCLDTSHSCDFMSMFLIVVDTRNKDLRWVRAGHDPALFYDPLKASFKELSGSGTALGIDATYAFEENKLSGWSEGQIIVIGTDGIWETDNPNSEKFGKFRLRQIIRQRSDFSAQEILNAILNALKEFRGSASQNDDVTLVVVKAKK